MDWLFSQGCSGRRNCNPVWSMFCYDSAIYTNRLDLILPLTHVTHPKKNGIHQIGSVVLVKNWKKLGDNGVKKREELPAWQIHCHLAVFIFGESHLHPKKSCCWFSCRKFFEGPNPTPFIADDSWPLFVQLLCWGNPKWGASRDQWNSALNYLIYWSSSKPLETKRGRAFSANLQQQHWNTTTLSSKKICPFVYYYSSPQKMLYTV